MHNQTELNQLCRTVLLAALWHIAFPFSFRGVTFRAVIDIADIDVSIKMSFDIHIDTEKRHIDIEKWYMYIV